jgi:hypothetical protein
MAHMTPETAVSPPRSPLVPGQPSLASVLDCYPAGAYWRVTGASVSTSPARIGALPLGGLECLQATPLAPPGDCRHGVRVLVHRARLGAEAAVGRGGALLGLGVGDQSQHFIGLSRGRPERGHLDQPGVLGDGNSCPPVPEAAPALLRFPRGGGSRARRPGQRRVRQLDRIRTDVTRCLARQV